MVKIGKFLKRGYLFAGALGVIFLLGFLLRETIPKISKVPQETPKTKQNVLLPEPKDGTYKVTRVIDGDTIVIETGEKIRYLGVDTPESDEHRGTEATEFNSDLVLGKKVRLELGKEKLDMYGRVLAYVWVGETLVNEKLIEEGLSPFHEELKDGKLKYQDRFMEAERLAKKNQKGIWLDKWAEEIENEAQP
jgi:endonuclease YncB( thermonuclease family)